MAEQFENLRSTENKGTKSEPNQKIRREPLNRRILLGAGMAFSAMLALTGCGSKTAPVTPNEQAAPEEAVTKERWVEEGEPAPRRTTPIEGFSLEEQRVGAPTDGIVLQAVSHEDKEGFYRIVFELSGDAVPAARAALSEDGKLIHVDLHGVRRDESGNRPLTTESGEPFGAKVELAKPPMRSFGRSQVLDDSLVRYEIHIDRAVFFRLHALERPVQVILDVAIQDTRSF